LALNTPSRPRIPRRKLARCSRIRAAPKVPAVATDVPTLRLRYSRTVSRRGIVVPDRQIGAVGNSSIRCFDGRSRRDKVVPDRKIWSVDGTLIEAHKISTVRQIQPPPEDARKPENPTRFRPYGERDRDPETYRGPARAPSDPQPIGPKISTHTPLWGCRAWS
jgi:hypothetical protein